MAQAIDECRGPIKKRLLKITKEAQPKSQGDLDTVIVKLENEAKAGVDDATASLKSTYGAMDQLGLLTKRVDVAAKSEVSDCTRQLQTKHSRFVSLQARKMAELEGADNEVQHMLLVFSEDYAAFKDKVRALEKFDIPTGHKSNETLGSANDWLKQIELTSCPNPGCPHMAMRKDLAAHEATCIFGMPLRHHSQISKERADSLDEKLELVSSVHGEWAGVYTKGRCAATSIVTRARGIS